MKNFFNWGLLALMALMISCKSVPSNTQAEFDVIVSNVEGNGSLQADKGTAKKGDVVTLSFTADEGWFLEKAEIIQNIYNGEELKVTISTVYIKDSVKSYQFTMDNGPVYISSFFKFKGPTSSPVIIKEGNSGSAGTEASYVLFGDWPQTVKDDDVTINEDITKKHGFFTYYKGSDDYWYVKCQENPSQPNLFYKGKDFKSGKSIGNGIQYFKVEPIKWRVLTRDYNGTGNALLLAEDILTADVKYYDLKSSRKINDTTIYSYNYTESRIRAFLNGLSYNKMPSNGAAIEKDSFYENLGFLQSAFTQEAQNLIAFTAIDDNEALSNDKSNDKIFLLRSDEVDSAIYVGLSKIDSYRRDISWDRFPTDYALANYATPGITVTMIDTATNEKIEQKTGSLWWLRYARFVRNDGTSGYANVDNKYTGIVPALTIPLSE